MAHVWFSLAPSGGKDLLAHKARWDTAIGHLSLPGGAVLPLPPSHVPSPSPAVTLCSVPGSCQAILHPDTNEKIFMPFRMSGKPLGTSGSA